MYRKHGLEIIVRPPHTTHVLQPEDVVSFRPLKIAFRAAKAKLLIDQGLKGHKVGITGEHMLGLLKVAWESAFCREKVVQAWKVTGYIPFTRRVYWNLLRKEEATAATLAEAGRVDPSYKESLGLIAASGGNTAGFAAEHGAGGRGGRKRKRWQRAVVLRARICGRMPSRVTKQMRWPKSGTRRGWPK